MQQPVNEKFVFRFGSTEYDLNSRTHVMGILNVTPDSFSDGGRYLEPEKAVDRALQMVDEGADFIDIGGESTRPRSQMYGEGANPVTVEEELHRVIPVINAVAAKTTIPLSVDTYNSEVARQALGAGAVMVNDISGFGFDPSMASVVGAEGASVVLMHIKGTPKTMQLNPSYADLFGEVTASLENSIRLGKEAGVRQMFVDPGLGFGKRLQDNLELINGLSKFLSLGCPILVGPSRKSFVGAVLDRPVEDRLEGSLAAAVASVLRGAHVVRVHDVKGTWRAVRVADAIKHAGSKMEFTLTPS